MEDIKILDNLLTTEEQHSIKDACMNSNYSWYLNRFSAFNNKTYSSVLDSQRQKIMSFRHPIFQNNIMQDEHMYNICKIIPQRLGYNNIINVISQLSLPVISGSLPIEHVDLPGYPVKYKSCIYYVIDSDGPTVIYKNKEVYKTVEPKMGRLVVFDGDLIHNASRPTEDIRCIINFCFH